MQSIHIPFKEHFFNESERADILPDRGVFLNACWAMKRFMSKKAKERNVIFGMFCKVDYIKFLKTLF